MTQQPPYAVPPRSEKATISLVLGILGIVVCPLILSVPAIVLGRGAIREIDASPTPVEGRQLAQVGYWLGVAGTVLGVVTVVFFVVAAGAGLLMFSHVCHNLPPGQQC